jgi:hypothetical protein
LAQVESNRREPFNRSTSILIAEARIALEPPQRISRVEIVGEQSKPFQSHFLPSIKSGASLFTLLFTLTKFFQRI